MFIIGSLEDRKLKHKFEEALVNEVASVTIDKLDSSPLLSLGIPTNFTIGEGSASTKPKFFMFKEFDGMSFTLELVRPSNVEEKAKLPK